MVPFASEVGDGRQRPVESQSLSRGFWLVVSSLVPIGLLGCLSAVESSVGFPAAVLVFLFRTLYSGFCVLLLAGTFLTIADKGYSVLLSVCLAIIAPIGTMIAFLLRDSKRLVSSSFVQWRPPSWSFADVSATVLWAVLPSAFVAAQVYIGPGFTDFGVRLPLQLSACFIRECLWPLQPSPCCCWSFS